MDWRRVASPEAAFPRTRAWLAAALVGACACGSPATDVAADAEAVAALSAADTSVADVATDPLVGTWTFSGHVPAIVTTTLTFAADKTFALSETVAPPTLPAGYVPTGCITTHKIAGSYSTSSAGGAQTLDWKFSSGKANIVSNCDAPANASAGTPMTADAVAAYTAQGLFPPMPTAYTVSATALVLTPATGLGRTFTR